MFLLYRTHELTRPVLTKYDNVILLEVANKLSCLFCFFHYFSVQQLSCYSRYRVSTTCPFYSFLFTFAVLVLAFLISAACADYFGMVSVLDAW
jgi:hypothetical protein